MGKGDGWSFVGGKTEQSKSERTHNLANTFADHKDAFKYASLLIKKLDVFLLQPWKRKRAH